MTPAGKMTIQLCESDLNRLLSRIPRGGVRFTHGLFQVEQPLPVGGTATCLAVPHQQGQDLYIEVPFDKIKGTGLGMFAGAVAKTLWGSLSSRLQSLVDESLVRQGLPREAVTLSQTTSREGVKGGLIRISLFHLNQWLAQRPLKSRLVLRVERLVFTPDGLRAELNAQQLPAQGL